MNCRMSEDELKKLMNFKMMSFWSVGLADPFPDETTTMGGENTIINGDITIDKWVYPDCRYTEGQSPKCIYVPSK